MAVEKVTEDDYGPEWFIISDLEQGKFEGSKGVFDAKRVQGALRDELWERYGPP
ncbi:hypothetical protein [Intrasporangium sp.]|uniref:hypothetical protein n=1 Tax=Intrasporangium sp. TaxID=1925024 RepID=UPI0033658FF4